MDVKPSNRKLMGHAILNLSSIHELWFDEWRWFDVVGILDGTKDEAEISTEEAVRWAAKNLERPKWKPELFFAERFPKLSMLVTAGETVYRFNARGWELVGTGFRQWDYCPYEGYPHWSADQYLFNVQKTFLLIEEPRFWDSPQPSDITAKLLEARDAAEWCLNNDNELPQSLEADCPIDLLTPSNIERLALAKTESVSVETESDFDEVCDDTSEPIDDEQTPSLRDLLTDGLTNSERNKLGALIELEQHYWAQPAGKANPHWQKRYDANGYQEKRGREGKLNLAVIARRLFESERDKSQNLNVQ